MTLLLSIFQVFSTTLAARRIGRWLGHFAGKGSLPEIRFLFETGLGLALISFLIFTAAVLHGISEKFLWGLWFTLLPLSILELKSSGYQVLSEEEKGRKAPGTFWFFFAVVIYFLWIVLAASLPPSDRDELIYQLEVPRQMLLAGGLKFFPDNLYAYFPQLANMLSLFGLGTAGEAAAKLYHALFGILTAAAIYGFGQKFLSKTMAAFAAFAFLTAPSVMILMGLAYVDLTYAFYAFMALAILLSEEGNVTRRAFAAGLMAGCASAVKYPGLQFMGLLGVMALLEYFRGRNREWMKAVLIIPGTGILLLLPYLVRNFIMTGWPLFPFPAGSLPLHSSMHWSPEQASLYLDWLGQFGTPLGQAAVWHTLAAPVLVFVSGHFNSPQFYEGVLGPVFLLIPFLIFRTPLTPTVKKLGIFSLLFLYYWAVTTKQIRFLIPAVPVLGLLLAYGLERRRNFIWKVLAGGMVLWNIVMGVQHIAAGNPLPFWQGHETREAYLQRQLAVYKIYQETNQRLGAEHCVYLINMKNYGYFLNVPWTGDFIFERYRLDNILEERPSAEALAGYFRNLKVTHLLLDEAYVMSPQWGIDPERLPLFRDFMNRSARLVVRDGAYALYELH